MTDREKNIAIAEWCGWRIVHVSHGALVHWSSKEWRGPNNEIGLPDYCGDLNAMHEAEKRLKDSQWGKYTSILLYANNDPKLKGFDKAVAHATAIQRAEALLKTIGKWKE